METSVNRVIIMGRLGSDPELRYTAAGRAVASFPVGTKERWSDRRTGLAREKVEWHRIVVRGKVAELCRQRLAKGCEVYIEGRLATREVTSLQGHKLSVTEVVASQVVFLSNKEERLEVGVVQNAEPPPPAVGSASIAEQQVPA